MPSVEIYDFLTKKKTQQEIFSAVTTTLHVKLQEPLSNQQKRKQLIVNFLHSNLYSQFNLSSGVQAAIDAAQLNVDTLCSGFAQERFCIFSKKLR